MYVKRVYKTGEFPDHIVEELKEAVGQGNRRQKDRMVVENMELKTFKQFMEAFFNTVKVYDRHVDIYHNTTPKELRQHTAHYRSTRRTETGNPLPDNHIGAILHHDGSLHTFNAHDANHDHVFPHLEPHHQKGLPVIIDYDHKDKEAHVTASYASSHHSWTADKTPKEKEAFVKGHEGLKKLFPGHDIYAYT